MLSGFPKEYQTNNIKEVSIHALDLKKKKKRFVTGDSPIGWLFHAKRRLFIRMNKLSGASDKWLSLLMWGFFLVEQKTKQSLQPK